MEAATTERAEEATFISKSTDLRLVVYKPWAKKNHMGETVEQNYGFIPQFENGQLTTQMLREQAERAEVDDIEQAVTDAIATIRKTPSFNTAATNGIWEQDRAPDEPRPTQKDQLSAITTFLLAQDRDGLVELIEEEKRTHNRRIIIVAAEDALSRLPEEPEAA